VQPEATARANPASALRVQMVIIALHFLLLQQFALKVNGAKVDKEYVRFVSLASFVLKAQSFKKNVQVGHLAQQSKVLNAKFAKLDIFALKIRLPNLSVWVVHTASQDLAFAIHVQVDIIVAKEQLHR